MDSCTASLDGHDRIQGADCRLKGLEVVILVGEKTELSVVYTQTDTSMNVLLRWFEPSVPLCLSDEHHEYQVAHNVVLGQLTCLKIWCSNASYAS